MILIGDGFLGPARFPKCIFCLFVLVLSATRSRDGKAYRKVTWKVGELSGGSRAIPRRKVGYLITCTLVFRTELLVGYTGKEMQQ